MPRPTAAGTAPNRRKPPPTREQIAAAAIRLGVERFTMQALARALSVQPQALYRWVADRDDVLDLVADEVLLRVDLPAAPDDGDWRAWLRQLARGLRRELLAVPGVAARALTRLQTTRPFLALHRESVAALTAAGFDGTAAVRAAETFGTGVLGWIAREQSIRSQRGQGRRLAEEIAEARRSAGLRTSLPSGAPASGRISGSTAEERFDAFVSVLIDGLAATLPRAPA
ncbi:TetR/AcrR family transcriptional regulator [Conexibacter sp. CPCC 206217]|uniref:TetR/AcrR family transcriptional regulator n=1 Tax=Conexibacter sp. CPCC 206217 TaxID=3064574 RepID=UPI002726686D|nr:TetR/AcrR family transcriptional regulator C-terminal domain-containing protein [Conexibacter sp. CPCC 206217]MDO8208770.1 TetR/AcrR family transcriptional regulator C-terminal domain-containing protein [Conexibacter sp. CPCC 206217]